MEIPVARPYTVFLSHSSRDTWLASMIAGLLRTLGCSVWMDAMSLTGGQEVLRAIREAIQGADETIVLVSPQSLKSQWVSVEIGMAEVLGKRITPLLNHVEHSESAPLASRKAYELNDIEKFLVELKQRIPGA
jgi:TIR domain